MTYLYTLHKYLVSLQMSVLEKAWVAKDLDMQRNFNFTIQKSKLKRNLWDENKLLLVGFDIMKELLDCFSLNTERTLED